MLKATDFGPAGDGAAIQAALNALPAAATWAGDAVYVPAGQWICNAPLVIPAGKATARLFGDGLVTQLIKAFATGQPLLTFAAGVGGAVGARDFVIEDLQIDSEGLAGDCLLIQNSSATKVRRVGLRNFAHGASGVTLDGNGASAVSDTQIKDLTISSAGNGYAAINITPRSVDILIDGVFSDGNFTVRKGLAASQSGTVQVANCHLYNVSENVLYIDGGYGYFFDNCVFDNATKDVVYLDGTAHTLDEVRFHGCKYMIPGAGFTHRVVKNATNVTFGPRQILTGASIGAIGAGLTRYLGSNGQQPTEADTYVMAGQSGTIFAVRVEVVDQPGAGKTFTYTLRKNDADTPITGQIVNGWWGATLQGNVAVQPNDRLSLRVVTSGGAVATRHRWNFAIEG